MKIADGINFFGSKAPSYTAIGYHWRARKWNTLYPDFSKQVWLVTGASEGIGASIAQTAVFCGARVIAVARSKEKLRLLKARINQHLVDSNFRKNYRAQAGEIITISADLSNMQAISTLTSKLAEKVKIDVLINNVGILNNEYQQSRDHIEMSYSVNLLGQYHLTQGLIDHHVMKRSALIISVSSAGLYHQPLNTPLLNQHSKKFDGAMAYSSHKRAQIALTDHWRRRYADQELFAYAMHPGWVKTSGVQRSLPRFNTIMSPILRSPQQGADTVIWLAQKRPATRENTIWFDRKQRSPHIFEHTKLPRATISELLDYLHSDLRYLKVI